MQSTQTISPDKMEDKELENKYIVIDPNQPGENSQLLFEILDAADKKKRTTLNTEDFKEEKNILLTNGLRKIGKEGRWWILGDQLGKGSEGTTVFAIENSFIRNEDGYQSQKSDQEIVLKILIPNGNRPFAMLTEMAEHETEILRKYETEVLGKEKPDAKIFFEEKENVKKENVKKENVKKENVKKENVKKEIYIIQPKAKGLPLQVYLANNLGLSLKQRLDLIQKICSTIEKTRRERICHLDLKLENIHFDEETNEVTLLDFGSAQIYSPGKYFTCKGIDTLPGVSSLEGVDPGFHQTTAFFDPYLHLENSPLQIDNYSLAGVFGCILADWSEVKKPRNYMSHLSIFKNKNKFEKVATLIFSNDFNKRNYVFDELENATYLSPEEVAEMKEIIGALKQLGHEDKNQRTDLKDFERAMGWAGQESVLDPSSQLALQDLYSIGSFDSSELGQDHSRASVGLSSLRVEAWGLNFGGESLSGLVTLAPSVLQQEENKQEETEEATKEAATEEKTTEEEPKEATEEETKEETEEESTEEETKQEVAKKKEPENPEEKRKLSNTDCTLFANKKEENKNNNNNKNNDDKERFALKAALEDYRSQIQGADNINIAEININFEDFSRINFRQGFWVMKDSQRDSRIANYGLSGKLLEELKDSTKSIVDIFAKDNLHKLRNEFIKDYKEHLKVAEENDKKVKFHPRPTISKLSRINTAINAVNNPKLMEKLITKYAPAVTKPTK